MRSKATGNIEWRSTKMIDSYSPRDFDLNNRRGSFPFEQAGDCTHRLPLVSSTQVGFFAQTMDGWESSKNGICKNYL
jgi:hypothetical protein